MDLQGKKILFIGIGFYDYEDAIKKNLELHGATISYINSCSYDIISRLYNRIGFKQKAIMRLQKLRSKLIETTPCNNDYVFIIKGQNLTKIDIDSLKQKNPKAKFILYLWDSLVRHENKGLLLAEFDNIWSFDRVDCEENSQLKFRPLFYRQLPTPQPKQYDLSFIGWMHSDRLSILRELKDQLQKQNKTYYLKLYTGKFSYILGRYLTGKLSKKDDDLITTKPIPYPEFQRVTAASNCVLDIAHPLQSGLTIRTIETLAAGCHLLTTNADIVNYKDINQSCYTVLDRDKIVLPQIDTIGGATLNENYSLDSFISEIFGNL